MASLSLAPNRGCIVVPDIDSQWAPFRATITQLYARESRTLKDVQQIMEREYGFRASKHMYINKFKQWQITKQCRASEKKELIQRILDACSSDDPRELEQLENSTIRGRPIELRKVWRYVSRAQRQSRPTHREKAPCRSRLREKNKLNSVLQSPTSVCNQGQPDPPAPTPASPTTPSSGTSEPSPASTTQLQRGLPLVGSASPSMTMPTPGQDVSLDNILSHVKIFLDAHSKSLSLNPSGPDAPMTVHKDGSLSSTCSCSSAGNNTFFGNVGTAIYFFKSNESELAVPLLRSTGEMALRSIPAADIVFLIALFATLSPANTRRHPDVRSMVLQYLSRLCCMHLGDTHPLTSICRQLELDTAVSSEVSERSLAFMLDSISTRKDVRPEDKVKIQRALSSLCRRSGDLQGAENVCTSALEYCRSTFGAYSEQACQSMMELVYVYTHQNEYDKGLELCKYVLLCRKMRLGDAYPDCRSTYAMENMAELQHFKGNIEDCIFWLKGALASGWKIRGGGATTLHVRNKLEAMLVTTGRHEEAASLRYTYPAQDD